MSGKIETMDENHNSSNNLSENSSSSGQFKTESESDYKLKSLQKPSKHFSLLRQNSMIKLFHKVSSRRLKTNSSNVSVTTVNSDSSTAFFNTKQPHWKSFSRGCNTIAIIVLVEAKGLPIPPDDGQTHSVHCKFQLGSETHRSKSTQNSRHPKWGERFKLHVYRNHLMKITLWDKGKQKNFMGSCVINLTALQRERCHEVWQSLDDGFGSVHLSITLCSTPPPAVMSTALDITRNDYVWHNLKSDWNRVGQLYVKIIAAKGLSGRPSPYSVLELDNERVQTHISKTSHEPVWNKSYMFNIYDITSTLEVIIQDDSKIILFQDGFLGRVSIPLLSVTNGGPQWYALKDKTSRTAAKGNCPRVLLEMTVYWNPVKSALRVFRPKEVKYVKKPTKFDVVLVYNNIEFIRNTFDFLKELNERYKLAFEWENREVSFVALLIWLFFWYLFELWMGPLLLILPFFYFRIADRINDDLEEPARCKSELEANEKGSRTPTDKHEERTLTTKIQDMPEMTLVITNGIEFIASSAERIYHLASFRLPFLSYVAIAILVASSVILYAVPFKYLLMTLGLYKFTRKFLNPERVPNNDLLDFLSRVPDDATLKEWKQLSVPEPNGKPPLSRSFSA